MTDPLRWESIKALFKEALEVPPQDRPEWLDALSARSPDLAPELQRLLKMHAEPAPIFADDAAGFLRQWQAEATPLVDEALGARIGPYRLLRLLGEGGMGRVYLAERMDGHFTQQVALKVVRAEQGLDELQQRFLRERDILARLAHPNIAQLHDGGIADDGAPYFTLEYVDGLSLTHWSDEHRLGVKQRIDLMLKVCDAVAHAHRHLVVHLDIKPSNILVTSEGALKLLDFGISKPLDDRNLHKDITVSQLRPLTREYAAPEQVLGEPVTTATDIYSLGVLLYLLLSGHMPYRKAALGENGWTKSILEEKPEALDRAPDRVDAANLEAEVTRVDSSNAASLRGTSASALRRSLRGDLDRIVQRALAKAPEARYATVGDMANDLRAYRQGRAISGGTRTYRMRKFMRRHWLPLAAGATILAVMLISSIGLAWQAERIASQARSTTAIKEFLLGLFRAADPEQTNGKEITARELIDQGAARVTQGMQDQPLLRGELESVLGEINNDLGRSAEAREIEQKAIDDLTQHGGPSALIAASQREQAKAALEMGDIKTALALADAALERVQGDKRAAPADLAQALLMRSDVEIGHHHFPDAKKYADEALRMARDNPQAREFLATALGRSALVARGMRNFALSRELLGEEVDVLKKTFGEHDSRVADAIDELGELEDFHGRPREAAEYFRQALALESQRANNDRRVINAKTVLSVALGYLGEFADADRVLAEVDQAYADDATLDPSLHAALFIYEAQVSFMEGHFVLAKRKSDELIDFVHQKFGTRYYSLDSHLFFQAFLDGMNGNQDRSMAQMQAIAKRKLDAGGKLSPNMLLMLGSMDVARGKLAEGEVNLRKGLAAEQAINGTNSVLGSELTSSIAFARDGLGDHVQAEALMRDTLRIDADLFAGQVAPNVARHQLFLAKVLNRDSRNRDEVVTLARSSATALERFFGKSDPRVSEARLLIGNERNETGEKNDH